MMTITTAAAARNPRNVLPVKRQAAVGARRRNERLHARHEAVEALEAMASERREAAASVILSAAIAKWMAADITWQNIDEGQDEVSQATKAAGMDDDQRRRLLDTLFGPCCGTCGFRGCHGECRIDWDERYEAWD